MDMMNKTEACDSAVPLARRVGRCRWDYDADMGAYETECGHAFCINEGTPAENDMRFCPYCGGELWEPCGKINSGFACDMPKGSKCPDCGPGCHDFSGPD